MVEYNLNLIFNAFADTTRRDILRRLLIKELSVSDLAVSYDLTYAAVSKHLLVLEKAKLVSKRKEGKRHMVSLSPEAFNKATEYLALYKRHIETQFNSLENFINNTR